MGRRRVWARLRPTAEIVRHRVGAAVTPAKPGGFRFGPTPALPQLNERDASASLRFLRPDALAGDETGPSEAFRREREEIDLRLASSDLRDRVSALSWYHTIDLPGVTTPGVYDHRELVSRYGLPPSLAGTRVLDVATFDGFWAFEFERRGGEVTALDLPTSLAIDMPPPVKEQAQREQIGVDIGYGFRVAAEALGSSVDRREGSVYDLNPTDHGTFGYVHMGDLLLHLERPLEALRAVRSVCHGHFHLSDAYDPLLRGSTVRYLGGWNDVEWWIPSLETLLQWLLDAGFRRPEILGSYQINSHDSRAGFWRAIICAE